jgi:HK97 family phage prohead protease
MVREVISRGAFDGIEKRPDRVAVNRDHDLTRVVGRAVSFHPEADAGLVAHCRIARTLLGDETLQLADEQILDASAGFAPMPHGERWQDGGALRRVDRAYLAHIAMTPDPAYRDAKVLAVRSAAEMPTGPSEALATPATPNLDMVRGWRLSKAYDAIVTGR